MRRRVFPAAPPEHGKGAAFRLKTIVSAAADAVPPGELKAQLARIRQGFDRPLPPR